MNSPGKILFLTEWFVPGFKAGGPIKSVYLLAENLCKRFEICILTTNRDYLEKPAYRNITPDEWGKMNDKEYSAMYLSGTSVSRMLSFIRNTRPEIMYINGLFSFYFSVLPIFFHLTGFISTRLIIAPRGMLHDGAIHYKKFKKKAYLWLLKIFQLHKWVVFHATDQQERLDILKYFPKADIHVISNFIEPKKHTQTRVKKEKGSAKLIFVSRISRKKNLLFLIKVLSNVSKEVHLSIIGPIDDKDYWKSCQTKIVELPSNISVEYMGAKNPREVSTQLNDHHFFVLPTLGENFGHVIAEALVHGMPVLISDQTPWQSLTKNNMGWDINLDDTDLWCQTIIDLVEMSQTEYAQMSNSASRFIDIHFNISDIKNKYVKLFS